MLRLQALLMCLAALCFVAVGCDREVTGDNNDDVVEITAGNCFDCHNGQLDQAQGEWANSVHASGNYIDYTNRGGTDCTRCHNQDGYISYLETGTLPNEPFENVKAIGCFTCHNPHVNGDLSIRHVAAVTLANGDMFDHGQGNQCASCHMSRLSADDDIVPGVSTSTHWGPHHGPQGDMINGSNGWEFPGEGYTIASSPHALVVRDACVGCHMGNPTTHVGYMLGGHSWNMTIEGSSEELSGLCADASCHGSAADSYDFTADMDYDMDGAIEGYQTEMEGLLDSLAIVLEFQGVLTAGHPAGGVIADEHLAGALFNYLFIEEDRSEGVHNWNYASSLILASIDYVSNLPAPTSPEITKRQTVSLVDPLRSH